MGTHSYGCPVNITSVTIVNLFHHYDQLTTWPLRPLSHSCDKYPDKGNLRQEGLILTEGLESMMVMKAWKQGHETIPSYISSLEAESRQEVSPSYKTSKPAPQSHNFL